MRKIYSCPIADIIIFKISDVIAVSNAGDYSGEDLPDGRIVINPW